MRTVAALALFAVTSTPVSSTQGMAQTPFEVAWRDAHVRRLVSSSNVVAVGTVIDVESFEQGPLGQSGIHSRVQLHVEEALLGSPPSTLEFWTHGGRVGARVRTLVGAPTYARGERVAVFLQRTPRGVLWPTSLSHSKWTVRGEALHAPDGNTTVHLTELQRVIERM